MSSCSLSIPPHSPLALPVFPSLILPKFAFLKLYNTTTPAEPTATVASAAVFALAWGNVLLLPLLVHAATARQLKLGSSALRKARLVPSLPLLLLLSLLAGPPGPFPS